MNHKTSLALLIFTILSTQAKIIRNKDMIALYQNGNKNSVESSNEIEEKNERVLLTMQNVLCRNFPKVPCNLITQDETLRKLISQSIQQMSFKSLNFENKKDSPVVNSEELSNFLRVKHTGYFTNEKAVEPKKHSKHKDARKSFKSEKGYGRKKIKKFYPHKFKETKKDFVSKEMASISEEFADIVTPQKPTGPVWRMDYTKHGEPSFNKYKTEKAHGYGAGRRGKEVFIKKSFVRSGVDDD